MIPVTKDIAIIGGGSTGPMLLLYLAHEVMHNGADLSGLRINLIDPEGFGSGGIAYGQAHPEHRLNSVRGEMSPWRPDDFHSWCKRQGLGDNKHDFNRRADYARYVAEQTDWAETVLMTHGVQFERHEQKADIVQNGNAFDVIGEDGSPILENLDGEDINLTVGYGPNRNFENLQQYKGQGYIDSPYDHEAISTISAKTGRKPRVAFIGAGPALYDFGNAYKGNPADIDLTVFSREKRPKGQELLDTRDTSIEDDEVSITPDYLADETFVPQTLDELKAKIKADFAQAAETGDRSRRRVALDIMKNIKPLLTRVDISLAEQFLNSSLHSDLKHAATPVPEESQKRLAEFEPQHVQGKLNGNIERLPDGTFKISVDGEEPVIVDYIINGTGHGRHNQPVLESLKDQGLASVDRRYGTLATDETGYRLAESGIACIGPATHVGIDGMESFAGNAEELALDIIDRYEIKPDGRRFTAANDHGSARRTERLAAQL